MTLNRLALNNVLRDKWTYFAYFLSSVFSIFIFFCFSVSMFHPDLSVIQNGSTLSMAMMAGSIMVYIFSFMFISYSIRAFMKSREKTLGLFIIMGTSKKQLNRMIFKENMIIGIAAIITAIIFGIVLSPLFLMIGKKIMMLEGFAMYMPIKAILLTFVMFFILFFIISLISPIFIRKNKVINMLKSDKTDEKDMVFSLLLMTIGLLIIIALGFIFNFYNKIALIKDFVDSSVGVMLMFVVILVVLYILYTQLPILIIEAVKKERLYFKRTNMIIIADLKGKLRSNVKTMYLVTILFTGAFYAIVMLYAANTDVERVTKASYPYSYTYASLSNNNYEKQHINLIRNSIKDKDGYKEYTFTVRYKGQTYGNAVVMSQSEYNDVVKAVHGNPISLKNNEIYIVSGSPKTMASSDINDDVKAVLEEQGITPKVVGVNVENITPEGYFGKINVLDDEMVKGFDTIKVYGFNIDNWKEEGEVTENLRSKIKGDNEYKFGFFSAEELFVTEKNSKNLMFYVGFFISIIFVIAACSMIYFKLFTEIEKESVKFKGIIKIGLSKKELSKVITTEIFILMFTPFLLAIAFLFAGGWPFGSKINSYFTVAVVCSLVFLVIQTLGYIMVSLKYKKAILKKVI
ncbi:ABC transporter permease [Clostridium lundense]|uniref:ABC transporter permease n=1 Tax=Clostridium lundense TaxID=319475 RepID=UPI000484292C|nr:FtsX-like permease family protein [Clostridium lundense]